LAIASGPVLANCSIICAGLREAARSRAVAATWSAPRLAIPSGPLKSCSSAAAVGCVGSTPCTRPRSFENPRGHAAACAYRLRTSQVPSRIGRSHCSSVNGSPCRLQTAQSASSVVRRSSSITARSLPSQGGGAGGGPPPPAWWPRGSPAESRCERAPMPGCQGGAPAAQRGRTTLTACSKFSGGSDRQGRIRALPPAALSGSVPEAVW
jgi:hypothetical protein